MPSTPGKPFDLGRLLATIGTQDSRSGVRVLDATRTEIARNEECPAVHGEGALKHEVVMFGCENGVLLYKDGAFVKLPGLYRQMLFDVKSVAL